MSSRTARVPAGDELCADRVRAPRAPRTRPAATADGSCLPRRHPGTAGDRGLPGAAVPPVAEPARWRLRRCRRLLRHLRLPHHLAPVLRGRRAPRATWPRSGPAGSAGCCRPRCWCWPRPRWRPGWWRPRPSGPPPPTRSSRPRCTSRTGSWPGPRSTTWPRRTPPRRCSTSGRCRSRSSSTSSGRCSCCCSWPSPAVGAGAPARWCPRASASSSPPPWPSRSRRPSPSRPAPTSSPPPASGSWASARCWRSPPPGPAHGCPPHRDGCGPCSPGPGWAPSSSRPCATPARPPSPAGRRPCPSSGRPR